MRHEREAGVQDDTKAADLGGRGDQGAINTETVAGAGKGVRANDYDFRFIAVEFQDVFLHPCFNVQQAGGEGGVRFSGDGLGGESSETGVHGGEGSVQVVE